MMTRPLPAGEAEDARFELARGCPPLLPGLPAGSAQVMAICDLGMPTADCARNRAEDPFRLCLAGVPARGRAGAADCGRILAEPRRYADQRWRPGLQSLQSACARAGPLPCAARIFDWATDLRLRQQPGHGDGWLAGCYSRSFTWWFAAYSAWPSWYSVRTWRRMLNCWCSGTRTRFCSATSAGSGTSQQTWCGSPRWHGSFPAGGGPKSSRLRPRRCWPGTANWRGESTTRAGGESQAVRQQSRASSAWSFGWQRRIRYGDTTGSTANWRNSASPWRRLLCGRSCMPRASILRPVAQARRGGSSWQPRPPGSSRSTSCTWIPCC
jgi:hypothetical protein